MKYDEPLTKREREVAKLFADGLRAKEIAHELGVSVRTIENHRYTINQKIMKEEENRNFGVMCAKYTQRTGMVDGEDWRTKSMNQEDITQLNKYKEKKSG